MNILKPLIKLTGDIYLTVHPCFIFYKPQFHKLKGHEIRAVLNTVKPGDILLRRYHGYLNTFLTPGFWGHAGLYIGKNNIIHSLSKGVSKEDILDFCRCDDIAIVRIRKISRDSIKTAILHAKRLEESNTLYDFDFTIDNNKLYCTELIDVVYNNIFEQEYENKLGKNVLTPDSIYNSIKVEKLLSFTHK